jgi:hypothetical protein
MQTTVFRVVYRWRGNSEKRWRYFDGQVELQGLQGRAECERWLKVHGLSEDAEVLFVGPERTRHTNGGRWLFTDRIKAGDVPGPRRRPYDSCPHTGTHMGTGHTRSYREADDTVICTACDEEEGSDV